MSSNDYAKVAKQILGSCDPEQNHPPALGKIDFPISFKPSNESPERC
jgi:hypothetical protein